MKHEILNGKKNDNGRRGRGGKEERGKDNTEEKNMELMNDEVKEERKYDDGKR